MTPEEVLAEFVNERGYIHTTPEKLAAALAERGYGVQAIAGDPVKEYLASVEAEQELALRLYERNLAGFTGSGHLAKSILDQWRVTLRMNHDREAAQLQAGRKEPETR